MVAFTKVNVSFIILSEANWDLIWSGSDIKMTSGIFNKAFEGEESSIRTTKGKRSGHLRLSNMCILKILPLRYREC